MACRSLIAKTDGGLRGNASTSGTVLVELFDSNKVDLWPTSNINNGSSYNGGVRYTG